MVHFQIDSNQKDGSTTVKQYVPILSMLGYKDKETPTTTDNSFNSLPRYPDF